MKPSIRSSVHLARFNRWTLYVIGIGVWFSGVLWLLFHYFFVEQGEFGPKVHPLEPVWLKVHGAFAFAAIWIFGILWGTHVTKAWPGMRRRWSGGILVGTFLWLVLSAYLLYYVGSESARSVVSILHWGIGLASPICFGFHRLRFRTRQRAPRDHPLNHQGLAVEPMIRKRGPSPGR